MNERLEDYAAALATVADASPTQRQEVRDAAQQLVDNPSAAARQQWEDAVRALPASGGLGGLLVRAWELPLDGLETLAGTVAARALDADASLVSGRDLTAPLGPLHLATHLPAFTIDAAGPVVAALLPPDSGAARIALGPVEVSGALRRSADGWSGALAADLGAVAAASSALLRPGPPAAFVAVLGARFTPGIQLGFGFELSSVGGVVGVNVGTSTEALRAALSSGAATALFFPAAPGDPGEALSRLALLPRVFPVQPGSIVVGPAAELTWLQVAGHSALRLSLVALLELPRARFSLLGRAALALPPVLDLQLDLLGEVDPAQGTVGVDLTVVSGRLFGLLRVDGTAALRVRSADPAYSLFTLGGFYPGYETNVPGLPPQRRISMGSDLPLPISFRYEGYLALTDGTVQAGARVEVGFDFGVSVHGHLQFDAIAQYDPFHVHARLIGGVDVGALGVEFGGIDFHGTVDGPGPVVVSGRVSVELLGAEAGWNGSFRLGDPRPTLASPPVADPIGLVCLGRPREPGERVVLPGSALIPVEAVDPLVEVAAPSRDPDGLPVVAPLGSVTWSQTVAPFDTPLQRVRGRPLAEDTTLALALPAGLARGPTEQFAPAALRDADKDQLLTLPAYEHLPSGARVLLDLTEVGPERGATAAYDDHYLGVADPLPGSLHATSASLTALLLGLAAPATAVARHPAVGLLAERWAVSAPGGGFAPTTRTSAVFEASDRQAVAVPYTEPALAIDELWRS